MAIGGVIAWLKAHPAVQFSLIGQPADWQLVFVAAGLLGSAFALAMLWLREPPRSEGGALATWTTAR